MQWNKFFSQEAEFGTNDERWSCITGFKRLNSALSAFQKRGVMMKISVKALFQLEGCSLLHENRKYCRGGGVAIFVHESLC